MCCIKIMRCCRCLSKTCSSTYYDLHVFYTNNITIHIGWVNLFHFIPSFSTHFKGFSSQHPDWMPHDEAMKRLWLQLHFSAEDSDETSKRTKGVLPAGQSGAVFFPEKWGEGRRMIVMLTPESVVSDILSLGGSLWIPKRTTRMTPIASWQNKHKFLGVVTKPVHLTGNYQKIAVRTLRVHGWSGFIPFKSWCFSRGQNPLLNYY